MMNVMYVYRARNDTQWMPDILFFLLRLRNAFIHPVCVFDGESHPLKQSTVEKRRDDRDRGKQRMHTLLSALETYERENTSNEFLQAFLDKHPDCRSSLSGQPIPVRIREYAERVMRSYQLGFERDEVETLQMLLREFGFPVLRAKHDGEVLCSRMCALGYVHAVLSNDSDVFFFGAPRVLFRFADDGAYLIELDRLLRAMNLTQDQFTDLCLLCGTDFNTSVRGVGFCRAYALIQEHKSVRSPTFPHALDHELLDAIRSFIDTPVETDGVELYCAPICDPVRLSRLCFQYHIQFLREYMEWPYTPIELEPDEETI